MTFNGEMALILRYFTEFGNGPYEPAEVRAAQSAGYCIYSKADFEDFRPAGATHCTDGGEIWHGGRDLLKVPSSVPNFTPSVQR